MKKAKKLLVTLLVLAFVLSTVSVGFAATFSDVKDADTAKAITRLSTLNILNGYPDGTFKPDNSITRAEFAKIIVSAVGVGKAAELSKGTPFKDVPASFWASGYIKVASDMGIVKGVGNGLFAPNANVTYADAVTMIVRALGYEPKAQALGGYPGGYLAIAAEKDISKGINIVNTMAAKRGDVAKMVDNALEVKLMEQTGFGTNTTYEEVNKTLLENKLNMTVIKGQVTATPDTSSALKDNQIKIDSKTYDVVSGIDVEKFLGNNVKAWENNDDKIVYIETDTNNQEIVSDVLDQDTSNLFYDNDTIAVGYKNSSLSGTPKLYVYNGDTKYDVADNAIVYINKEKKSLEDLEVGMYANLVITGNEVTFIDAYSWDGSDMVVKDVNTTDKTIEYYTSSGDTSLLDLTSPDSYKITLDGQEITLNDVKPNDVLYYVDINDKYYITDVRNAVEGKLTKVKNATVYVDDKSYDVSDNAVATLNDAKDVKAWTGNAADYDDAVGANVTLALDLKGEVAFLYTDVKATTNDIYGVVTGVSTFNDQVKIYANGEKKTYDFDGKVYKKYDTTNSEWITDDNLNNVSSNIPVMFRLDKDGVVTELYLIQDSTVADELGIKEVSKTLTSTTTLSFDKDHDVINAGGTIYYPDDNIVILDSLTDPDAVQWSSVKASDATVTNGTIDFFYDTDNKNVKLLIFDDNSYAAVKGSDKVALVTDYYYDGDWKMDVKSYDDSNTTYVVKNGNSASVKKGDIVIFSVNADGDAVIASKAYRASSYDYTKPGSITGDANNIAINSSNATRDGAYLTSGGETYKFTDKSIVYEIKLDDKGGYDTIASASYTKILDNKNYSVFGLADKDNNEIKVMFFVKPFGTSTSPVETNAQATIVSVNSGTIVLKDAKGTLVTYKLDSNLIVKKADGTTVKTDAWKELKDNQKINFQQPVGGTTISYIEIVETPSVNKVNLTMDTAAVAVKVGENAAKSFAVSPSDATVTATSSDESVATATVKDGNVEITGVAEGTATITVTASKAGYDSASASFTVNVTKAGDPVIDATIESAMFGSRITVNVVDNKPDNATKYQVYDGSSKISAAAAIGTSTTVFPPKNAGDTVTIKLLDDNDNVVYTASVVLK